MSFNLSIIGQAAGAIATAIGNTSPATVQAITAQLSSTFGNPNQSKEDTLLVQAVAFASIGNQAQVNSMIDAVIALGVSTNVALVLSGAKMAAPGNVGGILMSAKSLIDSNS